jgi:hypothetical protein
MLAALAPLGCQRLLKPAAPPPDVRRPVLKSESQLAAEREERIRRGEVVPTSSPAILSAERAASSARRPPPLQPTRGAIEANILLINDAVLTTPEVLYPLRRQLAELRETRTRAGYLEEMRRLIRRETQQEIGVLLIYSQATAKLDDERKKQLEAAVDKELENLTAREYGGSPTRLKAHLKDFGLTREQWREELKRGMVVEQYTRETLMPQIQVRRDELLAEYQRNRAQYMTPEARELLLIELPFDRFLPAALSWEQASTADRAQAKLKAMRQAREASEALATRPFEDVARQYSLGLHAEAGGSWGLIARPLQPPYDVLSKPIFEYQEGQWGEPVETETGWYIVQCGRIEPARQQSFADVQEAIRGDLMERRFQKLSTDYVLKLAEKATISSLDAFVNLAVGQADKLLATPGRP